MKTLIYGAGPSGQCRRMASICSGIHARTVGPELLDLADELRFSARLARAQTPALDGLVENVLTAETETDQKEVA